MEFQKFIENFASQFDETEVAELTPETKFRDLQEWSSLLALSVMAMADEEYNVALNGDDIRSSRTILDLYHVIHSKLS